MIGQLERAVRRLRVMFNRSEWFARLFRLSRSSGTSHEPALVMVQIDGLSYPELVRALAAGEMPFVQRLLKREHFELKRMYSGVPATTSAAQGELFYGVRNVVPGFSFFDREKNELVRMIEPTTAAGIERELDALSEQPLLAGGSAYADNFTGGAAEPHFCPAAPGWGTALREAPPLAVALFLAGNAYSFIRAIVLVLLEVVIAIGDFFRGIARGRDFLKELKFIPTRVAITIILRELVVIGAKMDMARGLPIIHVNMLGYDEQSHRRGPDSRFAHWTLKGIDDAISRMWKASQLSQRRVYELWIHSDHGQEAVTPYEKLHDRDFAEEVHRIFSEHYGQDLSYQVGGVWGAQLHRAGQLGNGLAQWMPPWQHVAVEGGKDPVLTISALGPTAMIYWSGPFSFKDRMTLARRIAEEAEAPLVLVCDDAKEVIGWTARGQFRLPAQAREVFGAEHPYLQEAAEDLVALFLQPNAGDMIACGTVGTNGNAVSFTLENGAHGGAGAKETSAFAVLPQDVEIKLSQGRSMRLSDLRDAAIKARNPAGNRVSRQKAPRALSRTLRVMSYNVHSCIGMDGRLAPERIARVIARCEADVVCLQELDMARMRTGGVDQAHRIAHILDMDFYFHPALHVEEERYGDAVLSGLPLRNVKAAALPGWEKRPDAEPRGALWVEVDLGGCSVQVINTHLGLRAPERALQIEALLGPDWLGHPDCRSPRIFCGDLNALPGSLVHRRLSSLMRDVQRGLRHHRPKATFWGRFPSARIDHIFVDPDIHVRSVEVPGSEISRLASDHLPLVVEVDFRD